MDRYRSLGMAPRAPDRLCNSAGECLRAWSSPCQSIERSRERVGKSKCRVSSFVQFSLELAQFCWVFLVRTRHSPLRAYGVRADQMTESRRHARPGAAPATTETLLEPAGQRRTIDAPSTKGKRKKVRNVTAPVNAVTRSTAPKRPRGRVRRRLHSLFCKIHDDHPLKTPVKIQKFACNARRSADVKQPAGPSVDKL